MPIDTLKQLFETYFHSKVQQISPLAPTASNRKYFRLSDGNQSCIAAFNPDKRENDAFVYLAKHFRFKGLAVPEVFAYDPKKHIYLQSDLGNTTLFDFLQVHKSDTGLSSVVIEKYKEVLKQLIDFQLKGGEDLDFKMCYPRPSFDRQSMLWDLNYFKYYFLKLAGIPFDEQRLEDDFQSFVDFLLEEDVDFFMYRDFQSRNIMIQNDKLWFVDFQGGRKGALQYDLASFMFNARANLPHDAREDFLDFYIAELKKHKVVDEDRFKKYYYGYAFIRIMQALGAYGYRGFYERKTSFLQSIPFALKNLKFLLQEKGMPVKCPVLEQLLNTLTETPELYRLAKEAEPLKVSVRSFSYKKRGIPLDSSGNGGGHVFDCRVLPNPGREEQYKRLTGNDEAVIHWLKQKPEMDEYFTYVQSLVRMSVENYKERKFEHLMVSFGCTGGRHRSVYLANKLSHWLEESMNVAVDLKHTESPYWNEL